MKVLPVCVHFDCLFGLLLCQGNHLFIFHIAAGLINADQH